MRKKRKKEREKDEGKGGGGFRDEGSRRGGDGSVGVRPPVVVDNLSLQSQGWEAGGGGALDQDIHSR